MKTVQFFDEQYLERCEEMSANDIAKFLDEFKTIHASNLVTQSESKLISIKVPIALLSAFKTKAALNNQRYQTKLKELMSEWVLKR